MIISVKEIKNFLISVLIPLLVGGVSTLLSNLIAGQVTRANYSQLIKPGFAPPGYIFPIVWTILFILMGISAYIVNKQGNELAKVKDAMFYYKLQLVLVFLWSILFFGFNLRLTALIDLVILLITVVIMILKFYKINRTAAYLNIPYLAWLIYAFFLNYFIWMINK